MELYLNLPLKGGMVLVLVDSTNIYKQEHKNKFRFFPNEPVEVLDKIANRFLKEKMRKVVSQDEEVCFVSKEPYSGEWPVEITAPPRMPKRRTRAGQLRPQGSPGTHIGRRLPGNMPRKNSQIEVEVGNDTDQDVTTIIVDPIPGLKDDGDERFTRIEREDVSVGRKLKSLADKDFSEMKAAVIGQAVKLLGFKLTDGLELPERQAALETMCEIVSKEVEIAK